MKKHYIMVAYHKSDETLPVTKKILNPIQVGKANNLSLDFGIETDADFENNISEKNSNYCELTALYYAWKNIDAEYYGLFHYRRYFSVDDCFLDRAWKYVLFGCGKIIGRTPILDPVILKSIEKLSIYLSNLESKLGELAKDYNVILPKRIKLNKFSVKEFYGVCHNLKDYERVENIIIENFPEMEGSVIAVGEAREMYGYNMFIMRRDVFFNYMEWLFFILGEFEREYQLTGDNYQDRVFGFLSERMLNIYIHYHVTSLRIKEVNVIMPK